MNEQEAQLLLGWAPHGNIYSPLLRQYAYTIPATAHGLCTTVIVTTSIWPGLTHSTYPCHSKLERKFQSRPYSSNSSVLAKIQEHVLIENLKSAVGKEWSLKYSHVRIWCSWGQFDVHILCSLRLWLSDSWHCAFSCVTYCIGVAI